MSVNDPQDAAGGRRRRGSAGRRAAPAPGGAKGGRPGSPLSALGEFGLIADLVSELEGAAADVLVPEGDDAAVWNAGGPALATTDAMMEGVHFRREWTSPEDLGFKAISVNVSDIAAMGGEPSLSLIALGIPADEDAGWIKGLYRGMAVACDRYGLKVAGGDTFRSPRLALVLTVLGVPPAGGAVTRAGAEVGDLLFVTGDLGEAAAGYSYLKARQLEGRSKGKTRKSKRGSVESAMAGALDRFLRPVARLEEGRAAAAAGASAMIDISDGLAGDALHIASASGVGIVLSKASLPLGEGARTAESLLGESPERLVLCGGEDYELLIAVPPEAGEGLATAVESTGTRITRVGQVVPRSRGCVLEDGVTRVDLAGLGGYDHFKAR
jgi:thiamine-monophosphate kinase